MATVADALTFARAQVQTDSNGLTNANGLIYANEALVDFHRRLVDRGVDASQLQEAYRDGTAGTGTYLFPTDMLALKAIEVNYTDTNPQNYLLAQQVDVSNLNGQASFSWLRQNQSTSSPQFDGRGDWFEIFPTPVAGQNVSQMFRIFYYLKPTEYTSVSNTIAYPESQDIRILGWRICANYLYALGKIESGAAFNQKYEERVNQYIKTFSRGVDTPIMPQPLAVTGWNL